MDASELGGHQEEPPLELCRTYRYKSTTVVPDLLPPLLRPNASQNQLSDDVVWRREVGLQRTRAPRANGGKQGQQVIGTVR